MMSWFAKVALRALLDAIVGAIREYIQRKRDEKRAILEHEKAKQEVIDAVKKRMEDVSDASEQSTVDSLRNEDF